MILLALALLGLLAAALWWLDPPSSTAGAMSAPSVSAPTRSAPAGPCSTPAGGEFTPSTISIAGVATAARVLALPRDKDNLPSTPPETATGKLEFAWDRPPGVRPGAAKGNVLLNTHTYPDGTALGNRLLNGLRIGDRIVVRGGDDTLCYRVARRQDVKASTPVPAYYDTQGPPQLAILVCSGKRLGPGNWTHRTIWYASPEGVSTRS